MSERTPRTRDADLLELLLERGLEGALEAAPARGLHGADEELRALDGFLAGCRRDLTPQPAPRWVAGVLSRTTRQDLRWRGDLVLIARYVSDGLAASPALRAAAALLLLPLLGMPVLAWLVLRPPREPRGFLTGIEVERVEPFLPAMPEEPAQDLVFVAPDSVLPQSPEGLLDVPVGVPDQASITRALAESARAQATLRLPRLELEAGSGALARLLDLRSAQWNGAALASPSPDVPRHAGGLLGALEVEWLLDRWAREGAAPPELEIALGALGRERSLPLDVRRLEALALDRARSFGRVDVDAWARLARVGARPGERGSAPVDRRWRASLAAALARDAEGRELLADPDLAAWLAER